MTRSFSIVSPFCMRWRFVDRSAGASNCVYFAEMLSNVRTPLDIQSCYIRLQVHAIMFCFYFVGSLIVRRCTNKLLWSFRYDLVHNSLLNLRMLLFFVRIFFLCLCYSTNSSARPPVLAIVIIVYSNFGNCDFFDWAVAFQFLFFLYLLCAWILLCALCVKQVEKHLLCHFYDDHNNSEIIMNRKVNLAKSASRVPRKSHQRITKKGTTTIITMYLSGLAGVLCVILNIRR